MSGSALMLFMGQWGPVADPLTHCVFANLPPLRVCPPSEEGCPAIIYNAWPCAHSHYLITSSPPQKLQQNLAEAWAWRQQADSMLQVAAVVSTCHGPYDTLWLLPAQKLIWWSCKSPFSIPSVQIIFPQHRVHRRPPAA